MHYSIVDRLLLGIALFIHFGITSHYYPDENGNLTKRGLIDSIQASLGMEVIASFPFFIATRAGEYGNPLHITLICIAFYPLDFLYQFLCRGIWFNLSYQLIKGIALYIIITIYVLK